jgi:hypothetical protein
VKFKEKNPMTQPITNTPYYLASSNFNANRDKKVDALSPKAKTKPLLTWVKPVGLTALTIVGLAAIYFAGSAIFSSTTPGPNPGLTPGRSPGSPRGKPPGTGGTSNPETLTPTPTPQSLEATPTPTTTTVTTQPFMATLRAIAKHLLDQKRVNEAAEAKATLQAIANGEITTNEAEAMAALRAITKRLLDEKRLNEAAGTMAKLQVIAKFLRVTDNDIVSGGTSNPETPTPTPTPQPLEPTPTPTTTTVTTQPFGEITTNEALEAMAKLLLDKKRVTDNDIVDHGWFKIKKVPIKFYYWTEIAGLLFSAVDKLLKEKRIVGWAWARQGVSIKQHENDPIDVEVYSYSPFSEEGFKKIPMFIKEEYENLPTQLQTTIEEINKQLQAQPEK